MTEREKFRMAEMKKDRLEKCGYKCEVCGKSIHPGDFAHRVPQTVWALEKYGRQKIHHEYNLVLVCGDSCNRSVDIRNRPREIERLMEKIDMALGAS